MRCRKRDYSTADKFYDLEESQKRYQELVEENIWLKQQVERPRHQDTSVCQHCYEFPTKEPELPTSLTQTGDIALWGMLERNKYLEGKIEKLRSQYEKQSKILTSIKTSDKWKNRFVCGGQGSNCYEDKYLQLLRVRSPFY